MRGLGVNLEQKVCFAWALFRNESSCLVEGLDIILLVGYAYVLVPKGFMQLMFSTVYRVTQKDFYARQYTSMWAEILPHLWMRLFLDIGSEVEVLLPNPPDLRI